MVMPHQSPAFKLNKGKKRKKSLLTDFYWENIENIRRVKADKTKKIIVNILSS